MIPLIIVSAVILLIALLLFLPISLDIMYTDDFFMTVRFAGIRIFKIEPGKDIKKPKSDAESDKKAEKQAENPFKKLNREKGFRVALGEITAFVKALILRIKNQLRHIRITRLCLGINVATDDAALTAIYYGAVCSAVYPILSLLDSLSSIAFKQIDIRADFESTKPGLAFSARIKLQLFFLLAAAFAALSEFNKFKKRNEL